MKRTLAPSLRQRGFTLIEVLLALGIMISVGGLAMSQLRRSNESSQAQAAGEQMRMVGMALNQYITMRYAEISSMTDVAGAGTVSDPGPRDCDAPSANYCTITSDTLRRNGLVPANFSGRNAFGAQYLYFIRRSGAAPTWQVDGLVVTDSAYTNGGATPRYDLLGTAMQKAGADSGMTRSVANRVEGYNGAWLETGYPINTLGLLAFRAGYASSGFAAYLRRDGSTPMTGNLNMDAVQRYNIVNAGTVQARRFLSDEGADALVLGADPATGLQTAGGTKFSAQGGALNIRNSGGVSMTNTAGTAYTPIRAGDATVDDIAATSVTSTGAISGTTITSTVGNVASNLDVTAGRNVAAVGWIGTTNGDIFTNNGNMTAGGYVRALGTMYSGGDVYVGYNGGAGAATSWIRTHGTGGWYNQTYAGGWYMADATWVRSYADKNVYTAGLIRGGTVQSDGVLTAMTTIDLRGVAAVNAACAPDGLLAREADGTLMNCKTGVWTRTSGLTSTTQVTGAETCGANPASSAVCPAGYRVLGGGYRLTRLFQAYGSLAPQQQYPVVASNAWNVSSGDPNSCFQAEALCGR